MLGGKDDYDKSIHDPVEMTFAEVDALVQAMTKEKPEFIEQLYQLYVVHVAQRQWHEASATLRLIGEAQGFTSI